MNQQQKYPPPSSMPKSSTLYVSFVLDEFNERSKEGMDNMVGQLVALWRAQLGFSDDWAVDHYLCAVFPQAHAVEMEIIVRPLSAPMPMPNAPTTQTPQ